MPIGVPQDMEESVRWFKKAADAGHPAAQAQLGDFYSRGVGQLQQSDREAFAWYEKAASAGDDDGRVGLARCYMDGSGVAQDNAKAFSLMKRAAEHGSAKAQALLAACYFLGKAAPRDRIQAYAWMNIAAAKSSEPKYVEARDTWESQLSSSELEKAQEMSRELLKSIYAAARAPRRTRAKSP